jgi:hypothetical protein
VKEFHTQRNASSRDMEGRHAPDAGAGRAIFVAASDLMPLFPASVHLD